MRLVGGMTGGGAPPNGFKMKKGATHIAVVNPAATDVDVGAPHGLEPVGVWGRKWVAVVSRWNRQAIGGAPRTVGGPEMKRV